MLSLRLARASLGASQLATGTGAGLGKTSWPRASSAGTSAGAGARGRERKGTHAVDMARRAVAAPTAPRSPLAPNIAAVLWFGGVPIVSLCLLTYLLVGLHPRRLRPEMDLLSADHIGVLAPWLLH